MATRDDEPTLGKLVADASRDISTLISKEIELAKPELKVSFKAGGTGLGLFGAALFLLLLAVIMLSVSIAYFIHWAGLGLHWAFLIVFAAYAVIAAVLALIGVKKVQQVKAPEKAIAQAQELSRTLSNRP